MPNWKKVIVSGSSAALTSVTATAGFTGSLLGTASTASFVTGSNVYGPYGSNSVLTASYALNGGVTQLLAGPNVTLSPTNGQGQVTISSTGGGGPSFNTATGSYGSFYDTTTQTNVAGTARSMSLNITDITNGVSISGSTSPFNTYIKVANAGVYDIQFSAQIDKTDSGTDEIWIWIRKNGTDLSDSATSVQLVGNGAHYVAAWNFFVNAAAGDYFQLMWYSPDANVRLHAEPAFGVVPGIPSLIVTANRVDQFLSNTGSFSGSFTGTLTGTASYATQALSSSYALSASHASSTSAISGTTNYVSKFTSGTTIGNSLIYDDGTDVNIGTNTNISGTVFWGPSADYGILSVGTSEAYIYGNIGKSLSFGAGGSVDMLYISASTGNVGIGTVIPIHKLSVAGKIGGDTFGDSYLEFAGSGNTILKANNDVTLGYTQDTIIKQGGNVGIGTLTPAYKLSVVGKMDLNDGGNSVFIGTNAGLSDDATANLNVGIGTNALQNNLTGASNVAVGYLALNTNLGSTNTALGAYALQLNTTGVSNTAVGAASQLNSGVGTFNTSVGTNTLLFCASGSSNAAFGSSALRNLTSGSNNTALGASSLFTFTSGIDNTAVGTNAISNNTTGSENTALGRSAGRYFSTGTSTNLNASASIFIGKNSRANASGETNQIVIGTEALGLGSNTVVLGNDNVVTTALKGNVGIGTTTPGYSLHISRSSTQPSIVGTNTIPTIAMRVGHGYDLSSPNNITAKIEFTPSALVGYYGDDITFSTTAQTLSPSITDASTERMRITSTGSIKFNAYGSGTFTGTATQKLAVDNSGNVIEIPIGAGPVDGSGTANYITRWVDTDTITTSSIYETGGNIGIGTTSPYGLLEIYSGSSGGLGGHIILNNNGLAVGSSTALIFQDGAASGVRGAISTTTENSPYYGQMDFKTGAGTYASLATRMTIKGDGNVGIGTTSPGVKFVNSGAPNQSSPTLGSGIVGSQALLSNNGLYGMYSGVSNTGDVWHQVQRNDAGSTTYNLLFNPSGGNVGIGTITPAYKLSVVGKIALNDGGNSLFIGDNAGLSDDATANNNIAIGTNSSQNNVSGSQNVAVGHNSLVANTTSNNTAVGSNALQFSTTSVNNTAFGSYALNANTVGSSSIAVGAAALITNTTGNHNTGVGNSALRLNLTGSQNVGVGGSVMFNNTNGSDNVAIGWNSARYFGTGTSALTDTSGSIFLGTLARANASGEVNQIVIGMNALGLGSNTVVLGNDNVTTTALKGNVGIGTTSPSFKLEVAGTFGTSGDATFNGTNTYINSSNIVVGNDSTDVVGIASNTMYFPGNGNVGIGTTSPSSILNYKTLTLDATDGTFTEYRQSGTALFRIGADSSRPFFYGMTNAAMDFYTNTTLRMTIAAAGNVGIGTASPNAKLHIAAAALGTSTGDSVLNSIHYNSNGNSEELEIKSVRTSAGSDWTTAGKRIQLRIDATYMGYMQFNGTGNQAGISFGTGTTTSAPGNVTERMRIDSSGNVGIGTTSAPGNRLIVSQDTTYNNENTYTIAAAASTNVDYKTVIGYDYSNDIGVISAVRAGVGWKNLSLAPVAGNVGIGTLTPGHKLTVTGGALAVESGTMYLSSGYGLQFNYGVDNNYNISKSSTTLQFQSAGNFTFNKDVDITGTLTATVKSFIIDHPTKENKKLQYGVLEGPEHSVYVRGKLTNTNVIQLPDYWHALVHEDSITVNLTAIGKPQEIWVEEITDTYITVGSLAENVNCFYTVFAERKDVDKLVTEFDKE